MAINPEEFARLSRTLLIRCVRRGSRDAPFFVRKLRDHFGTEPSTLPVVSQSFAYEHPNLHLAMENYLAAADRSAAVLGVVGLHGFVGRVCPTWSPA